MKRYSGALFIVVVFGYCGAALAVDHRLLTSSIAPLAMQPTAVVGHHPPLGRSDLMVEDNRQPFR